MKAREVVLLLLIIGLGVFAYYAKTGRLDVEWHDEGFFMLGRGEEFVFQESQEISPPLPLQLQVNNAHGGVVVRGAETDKITIVFTKTIFRRTRDAAETAANQLKMTVDRNDARLILSTNRNEFKRKNFETHFEISAPTGTEVKIKNSYGLVKAVGTGATEIANPHGQVEAADISGRLVIDNSYEDVSILGAGADCRVTSPHSNVTANGVQGEFVLDHSYGNVEIENIAKKAIVRGSHSAVKGKSLKAEVEIETSYEPVVLVDTGPATIRGHHSPIEASGILGPLSITDNYARLVLGGIKGDLKIEGANMEIRAESVAAETIDIATSYENVEVLGFTGRTTIRMSHGDLVLEPEAVTGPIDVQAEYAAIRFGWPEGGRFPFEGRTKSARVLWNLAERPSLEETNGVSVTKAFLEETGKPSIALSTSYADIRVVEKRAAR